MNLTFPLMIRKVHGHSMVPVLPPGTLVIALRWFRRLKPQKVIIFTRENRETIKRIEHLDADGIYVLGDHAETSTDSRHYGTIQRSMVTGVVIWPRTAKVAAQDIAGERLRKSIARRKGI